MVKQISKVCPKHTAKKATLFCQSCKENICIELCLGEHNGHQVISLQTVLKDQSKPWVNLQKKVQKSLQKLKKNQKRFVKEEHDSFELNLKRAQAKCIRMLQAASQNETQVLVEAEGDIKKYEEKSVNVFESRLSQIEKEKSDQKEAQKAQKAQKKERNSSDLAERVTLLEQTVSQLTSTVSKQKDKLKKLKHQIRSLKKGQEDELGEESD